MRFLKLVGPVIAACAALLGFVGSASGTTITSPTGTVVTPTIHWITFGGHMQVGNPIADITCNETLEGAVTSHGSGVTVEGDLFNIQYTGCTNNWHATAIGNGTFVIHWTGGYSGEATYKTYKFTATRLGVTCTYEAKETKVGTVTGGNPATLKYEASIPINTAESSALCGTAAAKKEGVLASTASLYIDQ